MMKIDNRGDGKSVYTYVALALLAVIVDGAQLGLVGKRRMSEIGARRGVNTQRSR